MARRQDAKINQESIKIDPPFTLRIPQKMPEDYLRFVKGAESFLQPFPEPA